MDGEKPSAWRAPFLAALEASGNISAAARQAGVGRATTYRHRKAEPEFAAAWEEAMETAADAVEEEIRRRGVDGWEEPVFHGGQEVARIRRYSDILLMFLAKKLRPEFRDNAAVQHSGDLTIRVVYSDEVLAAEAWHWSPAEELPV